MLDDESQRTTVRLRRYILSGMQLRHLEQERTTFIVVIKQRSRPPIGRRLLQRVDGSVGLICDPGFRIAKKFRKSWTLFTKRVDRFVLLDVIHSFMRCSASQILQIIKLVVVVADCLHIVRMGSHDHLVQFVNDNNITRMTYSNPTRKDWNSYYSLCLESHGVRLFTPRGSIRDILAGGEASTRV